MKLNQYLLAGAAASALLTPTLAQAGGTYVSVFGGFSSPDTNGFNVGPFSTSSASLRDSTITPNVGSGFGFSAGDVRLWIIDGGVTTINHFYSRYFTSIDAFSEDDLDSGFVVGAAIGWTFDHSFRAELELSYRKYNLGGSHNLDAHIGYTFTYDVRRYWTGTIYGFTGTNPVKAPYTVYADFSGVYTSGNPYTRMNAGTTIASGTVGANAVSDGDLSSFAVMANLWYDFELENSPFTPFIGAGVGMAKLDLDYRARATMPSTTFNSFSFGPFLSTVRAEANDWVFAWQLGAGLGYDLGNGMMLSAQYRYFATGDADIGGGQDISVQSHEALIGLNIPLGN